MGQLTQVWRELELTDGEQPTENNNYSFPTGAMSTSAAVPDLRQRKGQEQKSQEWDGDSYPFN